MTTVLDAPRLTLAEWQAIVNDPTDRTYRHLTGLGPSVPEFLAWYQHEKGRSPSTVEKVENALRRFAWFLGEKQLEQVTRDDCRRFLASLVDENGVVYPRARGNAWAALRVFFRYWHQEERIEKNPMEYVESPPAKRTQPKNLFDAAEIASVLRAAGGRFYVRDLAAASLLFYAGLRNEELRDLQVRDIDLRARKVIVRHGKGDKRRVIPFSEAGTLHNVLTSLLLTPVERLGRAERPSRKVTTRSLVETDYVFFRARANATGPCAWPSQPMSNQSLNRWWHVLLEEAGVPYRHPHVARHTFGTTLARQRTSMADSKGIQSLMGHASIQITLDYYVWPTEADSVALVDALEAAYGED